MSEWISVDERLPDEALHVLVWKKDSGAGESLYSPDRDFFQEWQQQHSACLKDNKYAAS